MVIKKGESKSRLFFNFSVKLALGSDFPESPRPSPPVQPLSLSVKHERFEVAWVWFMDFQFTIFQVSLLEFLSQDKGDHLFQNRSEVIIYLVTYFRNHFDKDKRHSGEENRGTECDITCMSHVARFRHLRETFFWFYFYFFMIYLTL